MNYRDGSAFRDPEAKAVAQVLFYDSNNATTEKEENVPCTLAASMGIVFILENLFFMSTPHFLSVL